MSEVLSQNEIDSLLQALNSGELDVEEIKEGPERPVKNYDFARPSKFSKDHLRTLEIIFENYGRVLSSALPGYLRKAVQVEVISSEAVTFSEFSNALSNPVLLAIVNFEPLNGTILMELATNLGFVMVDRMLGGVGLPLEKTREFSEIELLIIERLLNVCVNQLREPWANVLDLRPRLERIETNSQFAQLISPTEMAAIVTLNVRIGETEGLMNFCLPYLTLKEVMDKLNTKYWYANAQTFEVEENSEQIQALIAKAPMPIKAVLGSSYVSVTDFLNLQLGDIIRLDKKVDEELDVFVGNIHKFKALPGAVEDNYAVRLTSIIREG